MENPLQDIASWRRRPRLTGIPSICSAHPQVIEAAMRRATAQGVPLLIEATCNQVNQDGGYTGMTPRDFRDLVRFHCGRVGFPFEQVILGGDHLGPNPWRRLPADQAMEKARAMIGAYAEAGFAKLHLDTSMGCAGEPEALDDALTASRAASLAAVAEATAGGGAVKPVYVIGTEVPVPGGVAEEIGELSVTTPDAVAETVHVHQQAFAAAGVGQAFERTIAVVVQPGVEFGNHNVHPFEPARAAPLGAVLARFPGLVFEAHSTDYQTPAALKALVEGGFAILKVGPALTFALREALYGLDHIAEVMFPAARPETLRATVERVMLDHPDHWRNYYSGSPAEQHLQRHFSYSDRVRYYWAHPDVAHAAENLLTCFDGCQIPETLLSQYFKECGRAPHHEGHDNSAREFLLGAVERVLTSYFDACR